LMILEVFSNLNDSIILPQQAVIPGAGDMVHLSLVASLPPLLPSSVVAGGTAAQAA